MRQFRGNSGDSLLSYSSYGDSLLICRLRPGLAFAEFPAGQYTQPMNESVITRRVAGSRTAAQDIEVFSRFRGGEIRSTSC